MVVRAEPARLLAVVRERMAVSEVPARFSNLLARVYAAAASTGLVLDGRNVFVYRGAGIGPIDVEFGVGVAAPFDAIGEVECSTLPAGLVASTAHFGTYETLGAAHEAIHAWSRGTGRALDAVRWEAYGHWEDDPARRRTDVFYRLAPLAPGSKERRVAVGVAGLCLLALAGFLTLGTALIAPVGIYVARLLARRDNEELTRSRSWLGAVLAANALMLIVGIVALTRAPGGVLTSIEHSADSAAVASRTQAPPEWVERIAPGTTARARAGGGASKGLTKAFLLWATIVGGVIACALFALVVGTLGWLPGLLLAYALTGRWIAGRGPPKADTVM